MTPVTQASAFFWSVLLSTIFIISWIQRSFYVFAHNEGRVFICRLFQRSYYDEYSSLENTIQWTYPPFLVGSPLSFLFIFCTDCTVMSAFRSVLHSLVLSPDLQSFFIENQSFETYLPLVFLYCSISAMIRNRTVPSCFPPCTFPVSDSDHCPVFILKIFPTDWAVIFQNIRCCDSSLLFVYSIADTIQL